MSYPQLRLKPGKEKSLDRWHPWVFSGALAQDIKHTPEGSLVEVADINGHFKGIGYVQHGSIAVRIISFTPCFIDTDFWINKLQNSLSLRQYLGIINPQTNCYRLMHGEGDGIPGLVIDIYNKAAVIQCHSSGLFQHIPDIASAIQSVFKSSIETIYNKSAEASHSKQNAIQNGLLYGEQTDDIILENGIQFHVNWASGQKTGFFLDQRDNRALLGHYAKDKTVLNTFAYTGGFSAYAMMNKAKHVDSVDVSKNAIELLNQNMSLNDPNNTHYNSFAEDTFQFFKANQDTYDIVVLDPPAFAKNIGARHNALMGYKRLNIEGLKKVKPGGLLFTFSCSQVVDSTHFNQIIYSAGIESNRNIRILHRLSQGADHPVNLFHPEGEYLKGLVLCVE
jgi:23S rRNA (cytosine1962-C5)-methyltransferase